MTERPFMGKVELDYEDPEYEEKLEALRQRAAEFGSNVVPLARILGQPVQVYYGTNHPYTYTAEGKSELTSV